MLSNVHPASTALLLLGYALALPALARTGRVLRTGNRLALFGHQVGILLATVGWLLQRHTMIALLHLVWVVAVRFLAGRTRAGQTAPHARTGGSRK